MASTIQQLKHIFFDCNSTLPVVKEAKIAMNEAMSLQGNPSSVHYYGRKVRKLVEESREIICKSLHVSGPENIIFNSGGTEGNNTVLNTFISREANIFISATEHKSILEVVPNAQQIPIDKNGVINLSWLRDNLSKINNGKPTLVSVMLANNETGVIQPLKQVIEICRKYNCYIHSDCIAAWGKIPLDLNIYPVDYLTLSSHKIGGPAGCGVLYAAPKVPYKSLINGGAQEKNRRSGTLGVINIAGFGAAVKKNNPTEWQKCLLLITKIEECILGFCKDAYVWGKNTERLPNICSLQMPGVSNVTQIIAFEMQGFAISAGSACSSGTINESHVLKAMGNNLQKPSETIRISISPEHTAEDVELFIKAWQKIYKHANNINN